MTTPHAVLLDGVAAYVDGDAITVGEVMRLLAPEIGRLQAAYKGEALRERLREKYRERLNFLIDTRLILRAFQAKPEQVNAAQLDREVERRAEEFTREQFKGDRGELLAALREEGLTPEQWRGRIRETLIVGYMRSREVEGKVIVSPADVRTAYEARATSLQQPAKVHLLLMYFKGGGAEEAKAGARRRAEAARQKVEAGGDFGAVAKAESDDSKAAAGGDWGWLDAQDLRAELAGAVTGLAVKVTSPVVEAEGDFYLLRVEERREAAPLSFDETRAAIERELREKEAQRIHEAWVTRLRRAAFVDIRKETPFDDE
jgi:peptidyl-prolyl cis-trans isomerase SurA